MTNFLTPLETYLFDLRGYLVLKGALSTDEPRALNATLDALPASEPGQWRGWVHTHSFGGKDGTNFQQIYEAGPAFEAPIDHPSWGFFRHPTARHRGCWRNSLPNAGASSGRMNTGSHRRRLA